MPISVEGIETKGKAVYGKKLPPVERFVAEVMYRFQTKRPSWSYCGLALVTRASSDWTPGDEKQWRRARAPLTRGLTTSFNRTLKDVFKGAATTVIHQPDTPLGQAHARLLENGTKPRFAKLTLGRRIAGSRFSLWKHDEEYDPTKHGKQSPWLVSRTRWRRPSPCRESEPLRAKHDG